MTPVRYLVEDRLAEKATSILVLADGPGATQTISFDLPLRALRQAGRISLASVSEADFERLTPRAAGERLRSVFAERRPQIVVASRFAGLCAHAAPDLCRRFGARLIAHLDDDLFAVPPELGSAKYEKYADPARQNRLRLLCERAERLYVSTEPLKARLSALGVRTPILAGGIYCPAFAAASPFRPHADGPVFGYMGTAGHVADLDMIAPAIADALDAAPRARFETFGSIRPSAMLLQKYPLRVTARKAAGTYAEFLALMAGLGWSCGLAPLAETAFNRCKADTKFVEYSMAGIPTVASDIEVYRRAAAEGRGSLAGARRAWTAEILRLLEDPSFAASQIEKAQRWLADAYSLRRLEAQVLGALGLTLDAIIAPTGSVV